MEASPSLFSVVAAVASGLGTIYCTWRVLRTPKTLTVTRKDNGKSVKINMRAGIKEGEKLTSLYAEPELV
jgi:hypothetical protein